MAKKKRTEHLQSGEISAVDALHEAQKIAFAPVVFQVTRSLIELGILREVEKSGEDGATALKISESLGISNYGVETLLDSGQSSGIVDFHGSGYRDRKYFLTKTGHFLLNDPMTRINLDFNHYVCYVAMAKLDQSVLDKKPRGLEAFGHHWKTLYEVLPQLKEKIKECWDRFDHFYSSAAYPLALPFVFSQKPNTLVDIGANSGEFSILAARYDPDVQVIMVDLQGQLQFACKNVEREGLSGRITGSDANVLEPGFKIPARADIYWMSQFLSCFSAEEIVEILAQVRHVMADDSRIFVLETCWDRQQHEASAFSLVNTSPYFTCLANGNSKMYHSEELMGCMADAGLKVVEIHDHLGICHTLFECIRV